MQENSSETVMRDISSEDYMYEWESAKEKEESNARLPETYLWLRTFSWQAN